MPADKRAAAAERRHSRWRLARALGLDLLAISIVAGVLSLFTSIARGDSDEVDFVAAIFAVLGILYLLVARETVGHTLGEALLDVTYHPPRRKK
jgi:hypothetical protein